MLEGRSSSPSCLVRSMTGPGSAFRSSSRLYTVCSRARGLKPSPTESAPWGSMSTRSTWRPCSARAAPRLMVVVVLPTPPFWLARAMTFPISGTSRNARGTPRRHVALSTGRLSAKGICRLVDLGGGRILPTRPGGRKARDRPLWVTDHSPWSAGRRRGSHHPGKCGQTLDYADGKEPTAGRQRVSRGRRASKAGRGRQRGEKDQPRPAAEPGRISRGRPAGRGGSAQVGGERSAGAHRRGAEQVGDGGAEVGEGGAVAEVVAAGAAGAEGDHRGELAGVVGAGGGGV